MSQMTATTPDYQVIALIDDWTVRHNPDEALVFWWQKDRMQLVGQIAGDFVCREYPYEEALALNGIHRRFVLCIVTADIGELMEYVCSLVSGKDSRLVIIR